MRQINLRVPEELLARIDEAAGDVPRERWLRRAVEAALAVEQASSDAKEPLGFEQPGLGSVSSSEGVRPAAPAEQSLNRADLFRRATQR